MDVMEKQDYSLNLPACPEENPNHTILSQAKRVIRLLSLNADRVSQCSFIINGYKVTLPREYFFGNVPIYFLPGWGRYFIGNNRTLDISLNLPREENELLADIRETTAFLDKYNSLSRKSEKERAKKRWRDAMKNRLD